MKNITKYIKEPSKVILYLMNKNILCWLNDKKYLELKYKLIMKSKLDLENPQTFNEKMQWLKLYDRKPEYTNMVDKYEAKKYVAEVIGEEYIIPTIGIYDKFDDIEFNKLPQQFVIKCTHDSGGLVVCKDKSKFNIEKAKIKINACLKKNFYYYSREWPYKDVKPKIIIEKYMKDSKQKEDLIDYKFFCFNGEPKYIYISQGLSNHATANISFADMNYNQCEFHRTDFKPFKVLPSKPESFEQMKKLARKLSKDYIFLRVDFYEINKKIYFGELTFYPGSGYIPFEPKEYDKKIGDMIKLPIISPK